MGNHVTDTGTVVRAKPHTGPHELLAAAIGFVRRCIPLALVPAVIRARTRLSWRRQEIRAEARRQMEFLLGNERPDADIEAAAHRYVERMMWRSEARWHPSMVLPERIVGHEHVLAAQKDGRGVMVAGMHQGALGATPATLPDFGITCLTMTAAYTMADDAHPWLRQQVEIALSRGGVLFTSHVGSAAVLDLLRMGEVVFMAMDVPGRTPVTFLGRQLMGSFGAARLAHAAGSPVVQRTFEIDEQGPLSRLHPPLDPCSFETPQLLLEHMVALQEAAILKWPEYVDVPTSRWGIPPSEPVPGPASDLLPDPGP